MKVSSRAVWFFALLLSPIVISCAHATTPMEEVLQSFTACNGDFFYSLKRNLASISKFAPTSEREKFASIVVENRRVEGKKSIKFTEPVEVFGLHLTGYYDAVSAITPKEQFYYWGFFFAENPTEVRAKLIKYIKDSERLKADGTAFSRLEMHDGNGWVNIDSPLQFSGKAPGSYIERVLIAEESTEETLPGTNLICSIQGPVSAIVLADIRPDLPAKDYPFRPKFSGLGFDSVPLVSSVQKRASELLKNKLFTPKFQSASLRVKTIHKGNPSADDNWELVYTFQVTKEGFIRRREIYSASFFIDRLMLGNLVQLKSKLSDSDVHLTNEIKVSLPKAINFGQVLETEVVSGEEYEESIHRDVCTVGEKYPAKDIYKLLSGKAFNIVCTDAVDGTGSTLAFVEELGMFILRSSTDKNHAESIYEVVDFTSNTIEETRLTRWANISNEILPKMIDSETRLEKTIGTSNTFQYKFTLVNHTQLSGKAVIDALKNSVAQKVCTSSEMQELYLRRGATVIFSYYGKDGKKIDDISVVRAQCTFWQ